MTKKKISIQAQWADDRAKLPHRKNCAKCAYQSQVASDSPICDYMCKRWDETGKPEMRPYPAEKCPLWKTHPKTDKTQKASLNWKHASHL